MSFQKNKKRGYTVEVACHILKCNRQWLYTTRTKALKDGYACPFGSVEERSVLILDADRIDALAAVDYCRRFANRRNQAYYINAILDGGLASVVQPSPTGKGLSRNDSVSQAWSDPKNDVDPPPVTQATMEATQDYANDAFSAAEDVKKRLDELELLIRAKEEDIATGVAEHPDLPQLKADWKALDRRHERYLAHAWAANEDAENVREQLEKSRPPVPPYIAKDSYVRALMQKHQSAGDSDVDPGDRWWDDEPAADVSPEQKAAIQAVNDEMSQPAHYKVCKRVPSEMSTITIRIAAKILHCSEHYLRCRLKTHPNVYPPFFVPPGTRRILFKRNEFDAWFDAQQQLKGAA